MEGCHHGWTGGCDYACEMAPIIRCSIAPNTANNFSLMSARCQKANHQVTALCRRPQGTLLKGVREIILLVSRFQAIRDAYGTCRQRVYVMNQPAQFELYTFWRSSATFRVRVGLNLKGLVANERDINLDTGEQRDADFLKVNPLGGVPALIIPGQAPLTQSIAILEYLDEIAPSPPLLPRDPLERARVRSIAAMLAADTHPLVVPRVKRYLFENGKFDDVAWRAWQNQWFGTGIRAIEKRLANDTETGAYCHGDHVTIADIALASVIAVMRVFKIVVPDTPTVDRIMANCDRLDAFAKADPFKQSGAPS